MPGIFGFLPKSPVDKEANEKLLKDMVNILSHQNNYVVDISANSRIALGRVSLGILSKTPQPVMSHDNQYSLFMDGQVDNIRELRTH